MNILYIDSGNHVADNYMYQYYGDLFRELKKKANVMLYTSPVKSFKAISDSNVDCIIFGLGYFPQNRKQAYRKIKGLSDCKVPVVALLHKPQTMLEEKLRLCKVNKIDILVDTDITYKEFGEQVGAHPIRFWFTASPDMFHQRPIPKKYEIGFSGADHGGDKIKGSANDLRNRIHQELQKTKYSLFWNSSRDLSYRIPSTLDYAMKINECKAWVATTGPNNDISPRYFEVMMSRTLLLCNNMPYEYEGVFVDGVNCVMFENDLSDFHEKLDFYMNHSFERNKIINTAHDMAVRNYTWGHMADKLLKKIEELKCPSK